MIGMMLIVFLFYLGLTNNLAWNNLLTGLVIAVSIVTLLRPSAGQNPILGAVPLSQAVRDLSLIGMLRKIPALIQYLFFLIKDLLLSGYQVARIVFSKNLDIKPGVIAIPAGCESELARALSAHAITLTPGEMVIEMDGDTLYVHCLDATHAEEYSAQAQQLRQQLLRKIIV